MGKEEGGGSLLSLFCLPFSLSLFRRSLSLLSSLSCLLSLLSFSLTSFSFSSLFPLLSSLSSLSLSATMTMITRPVGSLCVHTALTCRCVRVPVLWPIPCWPNMFLSCKKQLSWSNCASLVPLGMKWAGICAGKGDVVHSL